MPETRGDQKHLKRIRYLGLKAPAVEDKLHRRKPGVGWDPFDWVPDTVGETLGRKAVELVGGEMMPGTVLTKEHAKKVMAKEKQFFYMTKAAKDLVLRYVGTGGRSL